MVRRSFQRFFWKVCVLCVGGIWCCAANAEPKAVERGKFDSLVNEAIGKFQCGLDQTRRTQAVSDPLLPFASRDSLRILIIGSSSTKGVGASAADLAYPFAFSRLLQEAHPHLRLYVTAAGIGGETASGAILRLPTLIATHQPDLVYWQVGTNDALARSVSLSDFTAHLDEGLRFAEGVPIIFIDPQFFPRIAKRKRYIAFVERLHAFAAENGHMVIKRFERMRAAGDKIDLLLAKDHFHMNDLGHLCLALDMIGEMAVRRARF